MATTFVLPATINAMVQKLEPSLKHMEFCSKSWSLVRYGRSSLMNYSYLVTHNYAASSTCTGREVWFLCSGLEAWVNDCLTWNCESHDMCTCSYCICVGNMQQLMVRLAMHTCTCTCTCACVPILHWNTYSHVCTLYLFILHMISTPLYMYNVQPLTISTE